MQTVYKIILALCIAGLCVTVPALFIVGAWLQVEDKKKERNHENP